MNGILLVNKEKDFTSRDVVNKASKILGIKKIGHTGTLDPLATGVLVLCIGEGTKIAELLTSTYKEYEATIKIGIKTDTLDITGNVLEENDDSLDLNKLKESLKKYTGKYLQEVPLYSAVKVGGKKLYEYARNNEEVTLPKKEVDIKNIELLEYNSRSFKICCLVSKGTYIRSLINDICRDMKTIGVMSDLVRTKQGKFELKDTYKLDDIDSNKIISLKEALSDYLEVPVDDYLYNRIKNGAILENRYDEDIIVFTYNDKVIAIYQKYEKDESKIKPWKVLNY